MMVGDHGLAKLIFASTLSDLYLREDHKVQWWRNIKSGGYESVILCGYLLRR